MYPWHYKVQGTLSQVAVQIHTPTTRVLVFPSTWYSSFLMACQSHESKVVPYFFIWGLWWLANLNSSSCTYQSGYFPLLWLVCLHPFSLFFWWVSSFFFLLICMSVHINPFLGFDITHLLFAFVNLLCLRCPELKNNPHFYIVKSIRFVLFESCLKCFLTLRWQRYSLT